MSQSARKTESPPPVREGGGDDAKADANAKAEECALSARLAEGLLGEAGDGGGFGVVDLEDGEQLGDLQDFLELAAKMAEA